jgi:hypothetical protein
MRDLLHGQVQADLLDDFSANASLNGLSSFTFR